MMQKLQGEVINTVMDRTVSVRSFINNKERVSDIIEPCGSPLLIVLGKEQWLSTTAAIA